MLVQDMTMYRRSNKNGTSIWPPKWHDDKERQQSHFPSLPFPHSSFTRQPRFLEDWSFSSFLHSPLYFDGLIQCFWWFLESFQDLTMLNSIGYFSSSDNKLIVREYYSWLFTSFQFIESIGKYFYKIVILYNLIYPSIILSWIISWLLDPHDDIQSSQPATK